ncbi:hypothetical protein OAJ50_04500 [Candidatus Nitrosopelagicus sp.]|nr:hypothetical protein [Candidatus Nitrosopelagicus sp.]
MAGITQKEKTFYDMSAKKKVVVDPTNVTVKKLTGNRYQLICKLGDKKLYKFASEETAKKFS